jgi:hypothetical protein
LLGRCLKDLGTPMNATQAAEEYLTPVEELLKLHNETCMNCMRIMRQKNADYSGGTGDPYANFRIAEMFGLHPVTGILLRVTDKLQRIKSFIAKGVLEVPGESVDDACDDLVNYAILMKGLLREEREKKALKELPQWP